MTGSGPSTLNEALAARVATDPDGRLLDVDGETITAARLDAAAARLAGALAAIGLGPGDRVASLLDNGMPAVVTAFAVARLGAVSVPVNTAYKGEFLGHQLADSGARVVVVQDDLAERVHDVADRLPALDAVIEAGEGIDWEAALSGAAPRAPAAVRPGDLATIVYTAGTTGPSKGCMLSHHYVLGLARQVNRAWGRRADDVVWTPLPLFHLNALAIVVVGTLLAGGRAAIARRFSLSAFWPEVGRTGATIASLLGPLAVLVADDERGPGGPHPLRLVVAAPLAPDVDRRLRERFGVATFSAGYGLTEASLLSVTPAGEASPPGSAGRPNDVEFQVRVVGDDGADVAPGEVGEIVARPRREHVMFDGYWGRPDATAEAWHDGWFHTGDLGRLDGEGFLWFVDRKKDCLRRRGENISSFELEKVFLGHPDVADVAVHAVPSEVGEDDVKATVVLRPGAGTDEEALCRWSIERLPWFAVPRYVELRAELPRNPVGRVLKHRLRDEGVTAATWDREAAGVPLPRR